MEKCINPSRLKLARTRRQLTIKALAEAVGLTPRMVSEYEKDRCTVQPPEKTIESFARALNYPAEFLFLEDNIDEVDASSVSFRSLKSMKASQQHSAIGAGCLGVMLNNYFENKFNLFDSDLPDFSGYEPELAASIIRTEWKLGTKSISNVIAILESHGVRVFTLDEQTLSVDAFSFWKDGVPYIFLNNKKSGERSRFDAAHELGHLLLHKNEVPQGKDIEKEADSFASFFLMPKSTLLVYSGRFISIGDIIRLKQNWKVSAMALIFHMKTVGVISEWQYRSLIIEASKLGLRTREIEGIPREQSKLIPQLITSLKNRGFGIHHIAKELNLPLDEITNLLFMIGIISGNGVENSIRTPPKLSLVN
mgnify:CR=1 FL=1|tara:strand:+ start:7393 stop:8487 length:1095 start_codon:yes stop_codon:yes gene_type:complete